MVRSSRGFQRHESSFLVSVGGDGGMSDFSVYRVLKANWIHPPNVEAWLGTMITGRTLNVCCGMSRVGDVRIDTDENTNRTEEGDLFDLHIAEASFDTVICDPPFAYYNTFEWCQKLASIARKRLILSVDRSMPFLKLESPRRANH